jgi:large conductance mechanosensitive channel
MARTIPRTFKHFILGAAAVLVLKPRNALLASQRQDTPATTRDCPYYVQSVPLRATRCPYCTPILS